MLIKAYVRSNRFTTFDSCSADFNADFALRGTKQFLIK